MFNRHTRTAIACAVLLAGLHSPQAHALELSDGKVKIGVLTDLSGPYSGMGGPGSIVAANMAVQDCLKAECKGMNIEVVSADHQNKADIAASRAREWLDVQGVDVMVDLTNSAGALAVQQIIKDRGGIALYSGPAVAKLTNEDCARNGFHWMFDTYSLAAGPVAAMAQAGDKKWFFITVDYAFGHAMEKDATAVLHANGGTVVGSVRHPLNASDFSSFILQAQASGADVIAFANGAQDTVNAMKSIQEFGITGGDQQIAALVVFLTDVHAMGLETAQGLTFSEGFYWDLDDQTRAFATRFGENFRGNKPTVVQAGVYSSTLHYLKTVAAAGTDDWKVIQEKIREIPIEDAVIRNASIQDNGRVVHDMYVFKVKTPEESKGAWDYYKLTSTIPADKAFLPVSDSACPLLKQ